MSNHSPSKRRRAGREAFNPNADPMDLQPYTPGSFGYTYYLDDWLEGWEEERQRYEEYQEREEQEDNEVINHDHE